MNRSLTAVFSALEALLVVGIGIGIPLLPLTLMWGFQYGLQVDWLVFWRVAVDMWLLGHGADMRVALSESTAVTLGFAGAQSPFVISLAPLGFALMTVLLGQRAGRRIAETPHRNLGLLVAVATFAVLAFGLVLTSLHELARPSIVQGAIFSTLIFAAGLGLGAGLARHRLEGTRPADVIDRVWQRLTDWPREGRALVGSALIGGAASVAAIVTAASLVLAVALAVNYGQIIALYQGAHTGALGGIALTIAELAFVPNLVIWCASWLLGPGFAIGTGSAVSPLGTTLGPIPAVPLFGALPTGELAWGFLGLIVPVVLGFLVGVVLRPRLAAAFGERPSLPWMLATGGLSGVVAGVIFGLLAFWSAGAAGPGRMAELGPAPLMVGLCAALEIGVTVTIGLLVARPRSSAA